MVKHHHGHDQHGHGGGSSSGIPLEVLGSIVGSSDSHSSHSGRSHYSGGHGGSSLSPGLMKKKIR